MDVELEDLASLFAEAPPQGLPDAAGPAVLGSTSSWPGERAPSSSAASTVRIHEREGDRPSAARDSRVLQTDDAFVLPGEATVYLKVFGCAHNASDSEIMGGILREQGYRVLTGESEGGGEGEDADLWLINSCTVKDPSQAAFQNLVQRGLASGKRVVLAGCVPQADRKMLEQFKPVPVPADADADSSDNASERSSAWHAPSVVGVTQIDRIAWVVEETLRGNSVRLLGKKELPSLSLPRMRRDANVEIIPLSTGCLGQCTYCKTRDARGKLGSYALEALVGRVRDVVAEGQVGEIWLTSEDTGAWGLDLGSNIAELLDAIANTLEGSAIMVRLGMTNPPYMLRHLESIARFLRHPNVFSFLHVPVQSGSNAVLERMKREYSREEFERVADYLLKHVPGMTLATDVICGFPTETEADFAETLSLVRKYRFPVLNISQFYPRPGTPAAKMKRLDTRIVKERSRALTRLFHEYLPFAHLQGRQEVAVWLSSERAKDGKSRVGHTKEYVKVIFPHEEAAPLAGVALQHLAPGTKVNADIVGVDKFHVVGQLSSVRESVQMRVPAPPSAAQWLLVAVLAAALLAMVFADGNAQSWFGGSLPVPHVTLWRRLGRLVL